MGVDSEALRKLNADTFRAEARDRIDGDTGPEEWEPFLRRVLAPEFRIVRSSGDVDDRDAMIARIAAEAAAYRRVVLDEQVCAKGDHGMVVSIVALPEHPRFADARFRNIKVFAREGGEWRCVCWHVTRMASA